MGLNAVAIIGGGIAAPVLALALKESGIASTIYEARPDGAVDEGTITLTPNSLRILDALGLYEPIRGEGGNFEAITLVNPQWQKLGQLKMGSVELFGYEAIRLPRQVLRGVALRKAAENGVKIHYEHRFSSIVENGKDGRARITFTNGTTASADFVVGADGFFSAVRKEIFPDAAPPEYMGHLNLSGRVERKELDIPEDEFKCPCSSFGPDSFFAFMPTKDSTKVNYLSSFNFADLGKEGWKEMSMQPAEHRRLMEEHFCRDPWPQWLQTALRKLPDDEIRSWPYYVLPFLSTYISPSGKVALIGDAAHGQPPTGAQGANSAIEDARSLALVLSRSASAENQLELLKRWDNYRRQRMEKVVSNTLKNTAMLKRTYGPWMQVAREWMMWGLFTYFMPEDSGLQWLYGYRWESVLED
ncbi:MAG: hypothetical protein Q9157_004953 [Trypethelium eluteriae]